MPAGTDRYPPGIAVLEGRGPRGMRSLGEGEGSVRTSGDDGRLVELEGDEGIATGRIGHDHGANVLAY